MHVHSPNTEPYHNSCDAIAKYPEKCTALAARINDKGKLELFLPYGLEDIVQFKVAPTPHFLADEERMRVYQQRLLKKHWQNKWPQLQFLKGD
jgi:hypothetical protein